MLGMPRAAGGSALAVDGDHANPITHLSGERADYTVDVWYDATKTESEDDNEDADDKSSVHPRTPPVSPTTSPSSVIGVAVKMNASVLLSYVDREYLCAKFGSDALDTVLIEQIQGSRFNGMYVAHDALVMLTGARSDSALRKVRSIVCPMPEPCAAEQRIQNRWKVETFPSRQFLTAPSGFGVSNVILLDLPDMVALLMECDVLGIRRATARAVCKSAASPSIVVSQAGMSHVKTAAPSTPAPSTAATLAKMPGVSVRTAAPSTPAPSTAATLATMPGVSVRTAAPSTPVGARVQMPSGGAAGLQSGGWSSLRAGGAAAQPTNEDPVAVDAVEINPAGLVLVQNNIVAAVNAGKEVLTTQFNEMLKTRDAESIERNKHVRKLTERMDVLEQELRDMKRRFVFPENAAPEAIKVEVGVSSGLGSDNSGAGILSADPSAGKGGAFQWRGAGGVQRGGDRQQHLRNKEPVKGTHAVAYMSYVERHWRTMVVPASGDNFVWTADIIRVVEGYGVRLAQNKKPGVKHARVNDLMWNHYSVIPSVIKEHDANGCVHSKQGFSGFRVVESEVRAGAVNSRAEVAEVARKKSP